MIEKAQKGKKWSHDGTKPPSSSRSVDHYTVQRPTSCSTTTPSHTCRSNGVYFILKVLSDLYATVFTVFNGGFWMDGQNWIWMDFLDKTADEVIRIAL